MYNAGHGAPPPGVHELGDEVWRGNRPSGERGFTALGVPLGHPDYVRKWGRRRVRDEQAFLDHLPHLPDLQCAWLLLLLCGSTRANHALRNIPPDVVQPYAEARDRAICATLWACLGEEAGSSDLLASPAWAIATLPAALGGLGLQSAVRTAPAAYWGAWADCLGYLGSRCPNLARACSDALAHGGLGRPAMCAAQTAANLLRNEGWSDCPTWAALADNVPAPGSAGEAGPGDWPHGWQFHASRTRTNYFRERVLLPTLDPAHRALLLSQSGQQAAAWLTAVPADTATTLPPEVMQIALRRRLRLRLPLGPATCGQEGHGCGRRLDAWGDHALACPRTGYLAKRAKLIERAWIAVCREAVGPEGHVVPQQWLTHTSAPGVPASDRRRLDLVVYGASPQGLTLCCNATLVSPVTSEGVPHPRAEHTAGVALLTAERRKHATYPELRLGGGQRLCVLATEIGGRWSRDAHELVRQLVRVRVLRAPPALRACASAAWPRRWWGMLSVAVQHAIGGTALGGPWLLPRAAVGQEPPLDQVLALAEPIGPSRLPMR